MVSIRLGTPNDCKAIRTVMDKAFGPFQHLYTELAYAETVVGEKELLRRMKEGVTWVAEENGEILGTVSIAFQTDTLYVTGMAVSAEAQGKKLGYRLLLATEEYARKHAHQRLWLGTLHFLDRAIALYEGIGYAKIDDPDSVWCGMPNIKYEKYI